MLFAIWDSCITVGIKPPGCKEHWEDMDVMTQARVVAFHQMQEHLRIKELTEMAKARGGF
jgi:hypothetical protein